MSIETVASNTNVFDNFEESVPERRMRLHLELAINTKDKHELETEYSQRLMGQLATKQLVDLFGLECHKQALATLAEQQAELAKEISRVRQEQGKLVTDTAHCNTQVWRPAQVIDSREMTPRDWIELPYLNEIYNDGEDPRDLTAPSHDGEPHGPTFRYLRNAAQ